MNNSVSPNVIIETKESKPIAKIYENVDMMSLLSGKSSNKVRPINSKLLLSKQSSFKNNSTIIISPLEKQQKIITY